MEFGIVNQKAYHNSNVSPTVSQRTPSGSAGALGAVALVCGGSDVGDGTVRRGRVSTKLSTSPPLRIGSSAPPRGAESRRCRAFERTGAEACGGVRERDVGECDNRWGGVVVVRRGCSSGLGVMGASPGWPRHVPISSSATGWRFSCVGTDGVPGPRDPNAIRTPLWRYWVRVP